MDSGRSGIPLVPCAGSVSDLFTINADFMEPLAMLYVDPLDLLFENRNKLYGAYPLRKYYPRRLFTAMGLVTGAVLVFAVLLLYPGNRTVVPGTLPALPDPHLTSVVLVPLPVGKPGAPSPPAGAVRHAPTLPLTTPLIVRAADPPPLASVEKLSTAAIGLTAMPGMPDADMPGPVGKAGETGMQDPAEALPAVLDRAELMPEFPGGPEALQRYLLRNLRMPGQEEAAGPVRVVVRFVVDADGKVKDIQVTQSGGKAFDEEVKRVVSRMPVWRPGRQHQRNVAVYFSLPVSFMLLPEDR
jgi:protein TonB